MVSRLKILILSPFLCFFVASVEMGVSWQKGMGSKPIVLTSNYWSILIFIFKKDKDTNYLNLLVLIKSTSFCIKCQYYLN